MKKTKEPPKVVTARSPLTVTVRLAEIRKGKVNPGRDGEHNAAKLADLIESIKERGVLQPPLVRTVKDKPGYELIAGDRRLTALMALKATEVEVKVYVHLSDEDAKQLAVIENLQREDLTPIGEAHAFKILAEDGLTVEQIHQRTGLPVVRIVKRMKLLDLGAAAVTAIEEGVLPLAHADILARIHDKKDRDEATNRFLRELKEERGAIPGSQAFKHDILETFTRTLKAVPWKLTDASLKPTSAGPCAGCEHNTGNQGALFGDSVEKGARCNNPACFAIRLEDYSKAIVKSAKAKGEEVLTGKAAANALHETWNFKRLGDTCYTNNGGQAKYSTVIEKAEKAGAEPKMVTAIDPMTGKAERLLPLAEAERLEKYAFKSKAKEEKSPAEKAAATADKTRKLVNAREIEIALDYCYTKGKELWERMAADETCLRGFMDMLALFTLENCGYDEQKRLVADLDLVPEDKKKGAGYVDVSDALEAWLKRAIEAKRTDLVGQFLLKAMVLNNMANLQHQGAVQDDTEIVLKFMGTTAEEIEKQARKEVVKELADKKGKKTPADAGEKE